MEHPTTGYRTVWDYGNEGRQLTTASPVLEHLQSREREPLMLVFAHFMNELSTAAKLLCNAMQDLWRLLPHPGQEVFKFAPTGRCYLFAPKGG